MLMGAEIGLLVAGLYALVTGKLQLGKDKVVEGLSARLLGIVAMSALPIAFLTGILWALLYGPPESGNGSERALLAGLELGIILLCAGLVYGVGLPLAGPPAPPPRKP